MASYLFEAMLPLANRSPCSCAACQRAAQGEDEVGRRRWVQRGAPSLARQVRTTFRQAQRLGREPQPPRTSIRTERSEKARHSDPLTGRPQGHHSFPKYLGGLQRQTFAYLPPDLHYLYHAEVDTIVQLPRTRSGQYRALSRAEKVAMLRRLAEHAASFDTRYGTQIRSRMQRAVAEAFRAGVL